MEATFFKTSDKTENVTVAQAILTNIGVNMEKVHYSGYSDTNGISVYFKHSDLNEWVSIRVSDHGISNSGRMQDTICFEFDANTRDANGDKTKIDNQSTNKEIIDRFYAFLKK